FTPEDAPVKGAEIKRYLQDRGLEFEITVSKLKDDDWAHKWKEFFKPEKVTGRIVIKPTWEPYHAQGNEIVIAIDPGMAFGTGTHATTRACLQLIEEVVGKGDISSMFDVGTGSGILSIAAARLGVSKTIAMDIDETARKVAEDNVSLNKVGNSVRIIDTPLDKISIEFELVVANIIAEELVRLSPVLKERVTAGGYLVLSGIISEKADMVKESFKSLALEKEVREGEWVSLLFKKQKRLSSVT
ncbi:MAG: 50S ribosomal protein L11 methyltransferase, partial [Deltaproteobacteria bacterium]